MKKLLEAMKKDLWVVALDIAGVNLSYYLALLIRFYVNFALRPIAVSRYLPAFISFAPFYTVLCLLVFIAFRLYGGLWRYAGINDMNRIILANICTFIIHFLGTTLFFTRMPWTYYLIGGVLQFVFMVIVRFWYRALLVEKRKLKKGEKIRAVVVGTGENGRRVVKHLEESEIYRPVMVVGNGNGTMDGIPITPTLSLTDVGAVIIADPLMGSAEREEIKERCEAADVEMSDYTGFFSNLGGRLSLTELMSVIKSPLVVETDGEEKSYEDGAAVLRSLQDKYEVKSIEGNLKIKLAKSHGIDKDEALKAAYAAVLGDDVPAISSSQVNKKAGG